MPRTDLSTPEVARLARIQPKTIDFWIKCSVITCDVPAEGTGSRRRFTRRDCVFVCLARDLRNAGLGLPAVRNLLALLAEHWNGEDPDQAGWIVAPNLRDGTGARWFSTWSDVNEYVLTAANWREGLEAVLPMVGLARQAFQQATGSGAGRGPLAKHAPDPVQQENHRAQD